METAKILLKSVPDLKIVHLIRDPRGILNSRRRIFKTNVKTLAHEAKTICDNMFKNTVTSLEMIQEEGFKDRIATLYYEDLSKDPMGCSERLFSFLRLPFSQNVEKWIRTNMLGIRTVGHPFAVTNRDSRATSQQWRRMVSYSFASVIDRECSQLYDLLGFLPAKNRAHLRKLSITLIQRNKDLNLSIIWVEFFYYVAILRTNKQTNKQTNKSHPLKKAIQLSSFSIFQSKNR